MSSSSTLYEPERHPEQPYRSFMTPRSAESNDPGAAQAAQRVRRRSRISPHHHPRVLAALCYTVPVVPAWSLLARKGSKRESPFVRFHAAQALVFYGLVAAVQIALFVALVTLGGVVRDDVVASLIAVVLVVVYLAQAVVIAITWTSLMADCVRGDTRLLPVLGRVALRLERFAPRAAWARWRGRPVEDA
jgi:uncharacterized membrane protein